MDGLTATFTSGDLTTATTLIGFGTDGAGTMNWNSSGTFDPGILVFGLWAAAGLSRKRPAHRFRHDRCRVPIDRRRLQPRRQHNEVASVNADFSTPIPAGCELNFGGGTLLTEGTLYLSANLSYGIAAGTAAVIDTNGNSVTLAGVLSGSGALTKAGSGTLTLSGANTYTGSTAVSNGTLQLGDGTTNGSVTGDITDNAVLVFRDASSQTYGGVIDGSGTVTKSGSGASFSPARILTPETQRSATALSNLATGPPTAP